ncbi:MAG: type II toxin-antitoxin system HicB family antitoxin [Oscillospiraceae bacterium]|jgi:predicted RNase H-like HicB family nuclease|nr:type II toxin-antitoxin system HicB family antitoxin [Oscillospiraceae bacterium]
MKYIYPVILYPDDTKVGVTVPDLPGCHTFGENKADALLMARDAIEMWLWSAENDNLIIPTASETLDTNDGETMTLVAADTDEWRRANDTRSVKKTLSIPSWLNAQAEKANAPYSQILQEGLKEYLKLHV